MAHAGGRPTKLTDELIEQARQHVLTFDISVGTLLPTIEGLALDLHISRETLYQWEKENTEFSDILEEMRQLQATKLIQNSIVNRYNPTIAKMILSGKHGYVEKTEVESNVNNFEVAVNAEQAEQLIRARAERNNL